LVNEGPVDFATARIKTYNITNKQCHILILRHGISVFDIVRPRPHVYKVITLLCANQGNYFENANACSKRMLKMTVVTQLYVFTKKKIYC